MSLSPHAFLKVTFDWFYHDLTNHINQHYYYMIIINVAVQRPAHTLSFFRMRLFVSVYIFKVSQVIGRSLTVCLFCERRKQVPTPPSSRGVRNKPASSLLQHPGWSRPDSRFDGAAEPAGGADLLRSLQQRLQRHVAGRTQQADAWVWNRRITSTEPNQGQKSETEKNCKWKNKIWSWKMNWKN